MTNHLKIEVLGSGCPTCKKLYELTKQAVRDLNLSLNVDYVNDIQKIIELGVMSSPVLSINDHAVISGYLPSVEEIKEKIQEYLK